MRDSIVGLHRNSREMILHALQHLKTKWKWFQKIHSGIVAHRMLACTRFCRNHEEFSIPAQAGGRQRWQPILKVHHSNTRLQFVPLWSRNTHIIVLIAISLLISFALRGILLDPRKFDVAPVQYRLEIRHWRQKHLIHEWLKTLWPLMIIPEFK